MTGACFVCVVGPGFDSTSPASVRSRASHAAGNDGRLAQKTESGPHLWGQGCVGTMCTDVCSIPTSCRLCLFGTWQSIVVVVVVDLPLLRLAVEGSDNPVSLEKPCQASPPPDQQGRHSLGRQPKVQYIA